MYQRLISIGTLGFLLIALVSVGVLAADRCSPSAIEEGTFLVSLLSLGSAPFSWFCSFSGLMPPHRPQLLSITCIRDVIEG